MYEQIINKIREQGDTLPVKAGVIEDIGVKKAWLTEMDITIERELTQLILKLDPKGRVWGEEEHSDIKEGESIWIIDPISHTFNFLHGIPHYAVVISHMIKGKVVFAAMYDPSVKEMFTAFKGKGTFLNNNKVKVKTGEDRGCILYQPDEHFMSNEDVGKIYSDLYRSHRIKAMGSVGLHYAYVACGRVYGAITINKDTFPEFAGMLMVQEAGGKFTDLKNGELEFDTVGVIASNGQIHDFIQTTVSKYQISRSS